MSNNNDDNNNDATRSCSEIFVMTFGFYCPPCSFEHPYSCPVCAVIHYLYLQSSVVTVSLYSSVWHWVSKNVVGSELHVPIGWGRQKQRLNGHSKEAIKEIKAKKQMLKLDDYKDGERISATFPQSTLQFESQHTVSHVYVLSLPGPHRLHPRAAVYICGNCHSDGTTIWQKHESSPHSHRRKKKSPHTTWAPYICDCVAESSVVCIWKRKL